jgi:Family of unknown function (DUF6496)
MPGIRETLHEFKRGTLHSGSRDGPLVRSKSQAIAIGMNERRRAGESIPPVRRKITPGRYEALKKMRGVE